MHSDDCSCNFTSGLLRFRVKAPVLQVTIIDKSIISERKLINTGGISFKLLVRKCCLAVVITEIELMEFELTTPIKRNLLSKRVHALVWFVTDSLWSKQFNKKLVSIYRLHTVNWKEKLGRAMVRLVIFNNIEPRPPKALVKAIYELKRRDDVAIAKTAILMFSRGCHEYTFPFAKA